MKIVINSDRWPLDHGENLVVEIHSDGSIVPINFNPEYEQTLEALGRPQSAKSRVFEFIADDPLRALMAENIIPVGKDISKYMLDCIEHAEKVMSRSFPKNDPYIRALRELTKKAKSANGKYPKDTILHHQIIKPFYNKVETDLIFNTEYTPTQRRAFLETTHTLVLTVMYDQSTREWLKTHDGSITNTLLRPCLADQDLLKTGFEKSVLSHTELLETPERAWQIKHFFEFVKRSGRVRPS